MKGIWITVGLACCGCTAESTRLAIETQQRADQVQEALFERQHEGLNVLLFRDVVRRLETGGDAKFSAAQRDVLNEAWNERDLIEFWRVQFERATALRMIGVDAKLYGEQSIVDLLIKNIERGRKERKQMSESSTGLARWFWPLQSRKVQVAVATVLVAWLAQAGIVLNEESVVNVLAIGAALILGIAHEDAAAKRAAGGGE
ncbi:MAG: hypothetical protein HZB38_01915 [Planctomycetes bacterium]|nr:hypothetical protein [Planctomycetota bacterium]